MNFDNILKETKETVIAIITDSFLDHKKEVKKDIEVFLKASEEKLERWTILLASKKISESDFEWLLKSQKDLLQFETLYQAGISKQRLGHLKNKILKTIFNTIVTIVL
ncbi:hypothetical protein [Aquimarina agarilytica]|uniref:hypothetical protein n=1 Tax=Aquimarina agarilytica TaxID=1087449 RepID=UPI000288B705|nr:hypothetical protein [Aquimarina agarilytica]